MTTRIRAAISAKIRPTAMVLYRDPSGPWVDADFKLLEAYQILQDETCGQCGHPLWLCRAENVEWSVRTDRCQAERALIEWQNSKKDSKGQSTIKPGVRPYAVPYVRRFGEDNHPVDDFEDLPTRREFLGIEEIG